jgi:cell division protein FtsN
MKTLSFFVIALLILSLGACKTFKEKKLFSKDVDTLTSYVDEIVEEPAVDTMEIESIVEETEEVIVEPEPTEPTIGYNNDRYYMIVGSFFSEQLANKYANKMLTLGYSPLVIYSPSKHYYRVAAQSYNDYNTAINDINVFRNNVSPRAWVHVKTN